MEHELEYTYPTAGDGEEIQWDLMAKNGVISPEAAERLKADEKPVRKAAVRINRGARIYDRFYMNARRVALAKAEQLADVVGDEHVSSLADILARHALPAQRH